MQPESVYESPAHSPAKGSRETLLQLDGSRLTWSSPERTPVRKVAKNTPMLVDDDSDAEDSDSESGVAMPMLVPSHVKDPSHIVWVKIMLQSFIYI